MTVDSGSGQQALENQVKPIKRLANESDADHEGSPAMRTLPLAAHKRRRKSILTYREPFEVL